MPGGIRLLATAEADITTPPADTVTVFSDADDGNAPAYKDELGAVTPLAGADGDPGADAPPLTYQDHGNTGSTETVDAATADVHRLVLNAATVTFTFTGAPASGTPAVMRLRCIQDGTGGRLAAWPGSVVWVAGVAPTLSTAAGAVDVIDFETEDGGTTWYGIMVGQRGATGTTGTNGTTGGAISIPYTFSTTTTDSDPGNGNLRLSNATQASAVTIRADLLASDGTDWSAILATLADSTNTVKGHIRLFKTSDPTKWLLATVSAVASPAGYKNITIANVGSSGANPLSNGDAITLEFTRAGDVGASGTASVGTDPIFDAKGDLPVGTGADASAKLTVGANGTRPVAASGETTGIKWDFPPGYEFDYQEFTSAVTVSATAEATPTDVVVGNAVTYSGSDAVYAIFSAPNARPGTGTGDILQLFLYDGTTSLGYLTLIRTPAASNDDVPVYVSSKKFIPSAAAHTYKVGGIKSGGNATVNAGAGGSGAAMPGFLKIVKA